MTASTGADRDGEPTSTDAVRASQDFRITTSLRWRPSTSRAPDSPESACLKFHQQRLLASAKAFDLKSVMALLSDSTGEKVILEAIEHYSSAASNPDQMYKLTLSVSAAGDISIAATPLSGSLYSFTLPTATNCSSDSTQAKVYVAQQPTGVSSFTLHKTNHRPMYNTARIAAGIEHEPPTTAEVLLFNQGAQIMEASLSTVYFLREGKWITPASSCGGNLGSTRCLALAKGWCIQGIITTSDIIGNELIILSNGVRGFWQARLSLGPNS